MGTNLLHLGGALVHALPGQGLPVLAAPPLDVAPPPTVFAGLGLVVLAVLCVFVLAIGVVAFFVIRAVRRNRLARQAAPEEPKPAAK